AVNELRDELALSKFGVSYRELEEVYGKNKQDKSTLEKITAVRALYPQRISEAEPRDAGATYY
ncbi:MAG: biopolymer transporter ExbD, partial [Flavobacteriales bacterium]